MLRKLVFLTALLASTTVNAENWQLVDDGTNGVRLVVDVDNASVAPYRKDNGEVGLAVTAKMAYIDARDNVVFVSAIDGDDCVYKGAGTIVNVYADRSKNTYFWSTRGTKIYDAQGKWMCAFLHEFVEQADQQEKKKPNVKKQNNKPKINV